MKTHYRPAMVMTTGDVPLFEMPDIRGLGLVVALALNVALWAGIGATVWAVIN